MTSPSDGAPGFAVVVFWRAKPGAREAVRVLLSALAHDVRREPGALAFEVHEDGADADGFILYERYRDEAAFRAHRETSHFKERVLVQAVPLLDRRDIHICTPIDTAWAHVAVPEQDAS